MKSTKCSRRDLLTRGGTIAALLSLGDLCILGAPGQFAKSSGSKPSAQSLSSPKGYVLSEEDDAFLENLERASFQYFWDQANGDTGIVRDRCDAVAPSGGDLGSIAAMGFGLTALCIGDKREFVSHEQAHARALGTLRFLWKKMPNHRGFFYHWANINTGERVWDSEVSSVDTAILLCGVLMCGAHFPHSEISQLAYDIYNRVDWSWLSEDTSILPHGWTPESGFLKYRWDRYSELMMMYLLGLGSSMHPLAADTWNAWKRMLFEYDGIRYIGSFAPLFVHQYSQAWFDFRDKRDQYADYFVNSAKATEVHRRFCMDLATQFKTYSDDLWGITASDSAKGYVIWGGPPAMGPIDGSVVPCAAGGSLPFLPDQTMRVLKYVKRKYGQKGAWSRYGFVDAFNPLTGWYDSNVVGINVGITLLMAENLRTGFVWETFMKNAEAQKGMDRAGLKPYQAPTVSEALWDSSGSLLPATLLTHFHID